MTDKELLEHIKINPRSDIAHAYRPGRQKANMELSETLKKYPVLKEGK